jgi:thiamine kinase-like enzyme
VFEQAMNSRLAPVSIGAALTHLAPLDMVIWSFPNDPAMQSLPEVTDRLSVKRHLPYQNLPRGFQHPDDVIVSEMKIINYRAADRCLISHRLNSRTACEPQSLTLYAKIFADERGREIADRTQQLWEIAQREADSFLIARPLGYAERVRTLWQEALPGSSMASAISQENYKDLVGRISVALAIFHRAELHSAIRLSFADHLAEVKKKTEKLIRDFPQLKESLTSLARSLEAELPQENIQRLIHGDFHIEQLTVSDGRVALFDFDELALGDPLQDLANFIADLSARDTGAELARLVAAELINAYAKQTGESIDARRLNWHLRAQFITRAYRSYAQRKPDLENVVRKYLALAWQKMTTGKIAA